MHQESPQYAEHREKASERLSREGKKYFKYIEFDPDEELIAEIRKHPIGLLFIILTGAFVLLVLLGITLVATLIDLNSILGEGNPNALKGIFALMFLVLGLGVVVSLGIAVFLYRSNVIYLTTEKIAQVLYISLFNRKISQLSIGDVQDATVTQKGILAHIFNYGTLVIETAGEQQNYTFTYIPDPYKYSQLIVGVHEKNLKQYGN